MTESFLPPSTPLIQVGRNQVSPTGQPGSIWLYKYRLDFSLAPDAATLWEFGKTKGHQYAPKGLMDLIGDYGFEDQRFAGPGQYDGARLKRPYTDFALVGPASKENYSNLMAELADFFEASYGDLAERQPSFGFFPSSMVAEDYFFWGPGIFVPHPSAESIGRLSVRLDGPHGGDWVSPVLYRNQTEQDAGFYAGQRGLVASTWPTEAPAQFEVSRISSDADFPHFSLFLGASTPGSLPRIGVHCGDGMAQRVQTATEITLEDLSADEGFEIRLQTKWKLRVRYEADTRAFRLHSTGELPSGPYLALRGIYVPTRWTDASRRGRLDTLLEFDKDGVPLTKPLQPRRFTLQVQHGRLLGASAKLYDWENRKWIKPEAVNLKVTPYTLDGSSKGVMVARKEESPFGFVHLDDFTNDPIAIEKLLDCCAFISSSAGERLWSDELGPMGGLLFAPTSDSLLISEPSLQDALGSRLFRPSGAFPQGHATPCVAPTERIQPSDHFIAGGMVWSSHKPKRVQR